MPSDRNQQYIFSTTRFHCGCIYQTIDEAVFCPEHRRADPVGFITSQETILTPDSRPPSIQGLVMNSFVKALPQTLRNDERNSIHVRATVLDGRREEWADEDVQEVGLCAACFIDQDEHKETGVAMCECGDEDCSYRWCGSTDGLHALWRLHAQGRSRESMGIPEEDIFSYGSSDKHEEAVRSTLDWERDHLREVGRELAQRAILARQMAAPGAGRRRSFDPVMMSHWLDGEFRDMEEEKTDTWKAGWALSRLEAKMVRLYVIGAAKPADEREEAEEQAAPTIP